MNYIYYYDVIAAIILAMLAALYFMRRNYPTITNKIYLCMLLTISVSTVTDLITIYTIPRADTVPLGFNYLINILYLLAYNGSAIVFYFYVLEVTKSKHASKLMKVGYLVAAIDLLILIPTPVTHWGIYFDDRNVYCHGFLFYQLYVNSVFLLIFIMIVFLQNRKNLNRFQAASILFANMSTIGAVFFQMFFPRHLVANLISALGLILVYVSLQSPEHYIDNNNQCYNENAYFETVDRNLRRKMPFTLVAFTLDGFQYINQILGVSAGNECIDEIVAYLHKTFGYKKVYRLTGCRFVIMLENSTSEGNVPSILLNYFKTPRRIKQLDVLLTPYICIVHYPDFAETYEDISNAIEYTLKIGLSSHNQNIITASKASLQESKRKTQIVHIMKHAIHNHGFQVYYQPIYHIDTKKFSSAEALIRLWDENLGYISPDEFIPMAEENGMIIDIGELVFRQVCTFIKTHDMKALGLDYIEVNLSFVQCIQENLAQQMADIMQEYGIDPHQINFEITETASSVKAQTLLKNMDQLIVLGSTFSMDDYGTGFSTANYLVNLPLQLVKIDKSILWSAMEDEDAFIILHHTVEMLNALHKKIIVEGVETQKMVEVLTKMQCDYLQGFLYSKPLPEEEFVRFLTENN